MLRTITTMLCSLPLVAFLAAPGMGKNLGTVGMTYPIEEKDARAELEERAKNVDWNKAIDKDNKKTAIRNYKPAGIKFLPRALDNRTFDVDMTYTLDVDMKDKDGNILYPRGFTFNPLDYARYNGEIFVVINGKDRDQVKWFAKSKYFSNERVKLLLTDGSYYDLSEELKRPVFYAISGVIEKFQLQRVPSVIQQHGRVMEVHEIDVDKASRIN